MPIFENIAMTRWVIPEIKGFFGNKRPSINLKVLEGGYVRFSGTNDNSIAKLCMSSASGEVACVRGTYGGPNPNSSAAQNTISNGGVLYVPVGYMALHMVIGYKYNSVDIIMRSENAPTYTPPNSDDLGLNVIQEMILEIYRTHTSAGRKDAWSRYSIPNHLLQEVTRELVEKGLLKQSKSGAVSVTSTGKEVVLSKQLSPYRGGLLEPHTQHLIG